ncbi:MAG: hypothetical protein L0215_03660 [Gemmataceae bacterium]|nr:hypothetical protein [Gemmataceae bacterium]
MIVAAVLLGDDVFNMESEEIGVGFVKLTVLAAALRASTDHGANACPHQSPSDLANNWRAFDFNIATKVPNETMFAYAVRSDAERVPSVHFSAS